MKDFKLQSTVLAKEVIFDEMEEVAVFETLKFQEEDLPIEELRYVHKELEILAKRSMAVIHDELIRHLTKRVFKRRINKSGEVLTEPDDRSCRVENS
jgi:hypothetical protein